MTASERRPLLVRRDELELQGDRLGQEIETLEGEKAPFETDEDLRIQAARIGRLATVDPRGDVLEIAPEAVTTRTGKASVASAL